MRVWLGLVAGLCLVLSAGAARAEGESADWDGGYGAKSKRRSDFTLGASGGLSLGQASGYPNKVDKIDVPAYRSTTKLGLGNGGALWLGVALNDYLTFGLGLGWLGLSGNDRTSSGAGFLAHVDAYPLFSVAPLLEDLSLFGNFGATSLRIKGGDDPADGGFMSYVEGGLALEHFRFWQIAVGPSVSVLHSWSQSASVTGALVGARFSFYGGP